MGTKPPLGQELGLRPESGVMFGRTWEGRAYAKHAAEGTRNRGPRCTIQTHSCKYANIGTREYKKNTNHPLNSRYVPNQEELDKINQYREENLAIYFLVFE